MTMKKTTRRKADPLQNPVGRAVALQALRQDMLSIGIKCLMAPHGSEQRELLAQLAFMLGIGAEVAAMATVLGDNRAGLHQSLKEVVLMACDGCRWDDAWAAQLQLALEVSAEVMMENTALAMRVMPGARALADDITAGRIRRDAIAPLEWPQHCEKNSCQRLQVAA